MDTAWGERSTGSQATLGRRYGMAGRPHRLTHTYDVNTAWEERSTGSQATLGRRYGMASWLAYKQSEQLLLT